MTTSAESVAQRAY